MSEEGQALWREMNRLKEQAAQLDKTLAVVTHEQEMQRKLLAEQNHALIERLTEMNAKIDTMASDFHEARGGIRFGKWLGGIAVSLLAVGVSILAYFKGPAS